LSVPDVEDYRRGSSTLAGLAVFTNWTTNLTGVGTPERLDGVRVSGNFFELLGTHALLGRMLHTEDEEREARVTVFTHGLWLRRFGGDTAILGKGVALNGATYTVVGVLPPRFLFPFREAELAVPVTLLSDPRRADRGANFLRVVARLAPAVSVSQAKADLDAIAHPLQRLYPTENARKTGISLYPLHTEIVRDYGGMLWTLFVSVGVLLLVGCVNLANLLLVRAAGRRTEFAVRTSLGASRSRLACQLLGETALLAALGGAFGLVLAQVGLAAWRAWGPSDFPHMADIGIDRNVLLFAVVISGVTALACGVAPAWLASRGGVLCGRNVARTSTTNRTQRAFQRAFVTAQIAAATVLLIGMSLMARGLARLEQVPPGFTPSQALSLQLSLPPGVYGNREALTGCFEALRDRLGAIPGVESAGAISLLPLSGLLSTADIALLDRPAPPPDKVPQAHLRVATAEYFDAAGVQVLEGRSFSDHDRQDGQPVAIVSRTFAARHWPGESAVGKTVQIVQATTSPRLEIVGVVSDVKQFTLDAPATAPVCAAPSDACVSSSTDRRADVLGCARARRRRHNDTGDTVRGDSGRSWCRSIQRPNAGIAVAGIARLSTCQRPPAPGLWQRSPGPLCNRRVWRGGVRCTHAQARAGHTRRPRRKPTRVDDVHAPARALACAPWSRGGPRWRAGCGSHSVRRSIRDQPTRRYDLPSGRGNPSPVAVFATYIPVRRGCNKPGRSS
jgi:putative ABC transport system permease protein